MINEQKHTLLLGLAFLFFLLLSSVENSFFFQILTAVLQNQVLAVAMLFTHNILVVSLIILGMTFYVYLVLYFFKKGKYEQIVLEHPRIFAVVFAIVIVFLSILRGSNLIQGGINLETIAWIMLISAPIGIVEGSGIYLALKKTFGRTMSMKDLAYIYGIFFIAAVMEVGFIDLLISVSIK